MKRSSAWLVLVGGCFLAGCGGHGASSGAVANSAQKTALHLTINWPKPTSRDIDPAADMVEVDVYSIDPTLAAQGGTGSNGLPNGNTLIDSVTAARPTDGSASQITINSVPIQNVRLAAIAYNSKDPANATKPTNILSYAYAPSTNPATPLSLTPGGSNAVSMGMSTHYMFSRNDLQSGNAIIRTDWQGSNPITLYTTQNFLAELAVKPDGSSIATYDSSGKIVVLDSQGGGVIASISGVQVAGLAGDNNYLYHINNQPSDTGPVVYSIVRTDWQGSNPTTIYSTTNRLSGGLAIKPDGSSVTCLSSTQSGVNQIIVLNSTTGAITAQFASGQCNGIVACSAYIYHTNDPGNQMSSIVRTDWQGNGATTLYGPIGPTQYLAGLAINSDGSEIASLLSSNNPTSLLVLNAQSGAVNSTVPYPTADDIRGN